MTRLMTILAAACVLTVATSCDDPDTAAEDVERLPFVVIVVDSKI